MKGYADRVRGERQAQAWTVSHLLIAAGCEPSKVTPAKLLGEKERKRKVKPEPPKIPIDELFRLMKGETGGPTQ